VPKPLRKYLLHTTIPIVDSLPSFNLIEHMHLVLQFEFFWFPPSTPSPKTNIFLFPLCLLNAHLIHTQQENHNAIRKTTTNMLNKPRKTLSNYYSSSQTMHKTNKLTWTDTQLQIKPILDEVMEIKI